MTEQQDTTDTADQTPPTATTSGYQSAAVGAGVLAAAAWAYTAFGAAQNHSEINDIANDFFRDASAIQISQVSDQALVEIVPFFAASAGLTVLMFLFLGLALLKRP